MRAPISWLGEHVDLPSGVTPREVADALIRVGMEVEGVESGAEGLSGPIVVGRVLSVQPEPQKNGKTINWCSVDVGPSNPDREPGRGIVCGAHNFGAGELVVVALPGAVLPGGFAISARKTYGHVSDGMICSVRELGIGDDHEGILVLPAGAGSPGDDALDALGLHDAVLDVAVTTDRGYCLSIRGLAREAAAAYAVSFHDVTAPVPAVDGSAYDVEVAPDTGCSVFSARAVTGLDPTAPSPDWMAARLRQSGMRPISLAVDVTNYVMLETGQPLHAFDRDKLSGPIRVRRAAPGEKLTTLDGVVRDLHPDDVVITDDRGVIGLAGVMGGASTEIDDSTSSVVLEAAHWDPSRIAHTVRRHKLPSEAAKRFERDVDPAIAAVALGRCVELLVEHGGATALEGYTVIGSVEVPAPIALPATVPATVAGLDIPRDRVVAHLEAVGCRVDPDGDPLQVYPPTWRPDLLVAADLVEEVVRLVGYETLPSVLPAAPAGRGLTPRQARDRAISRAVASAGFAEVLAYPFVAASVHDTLGEPADDPRRQALRLVNPISADEPELRTSLLPGLLATVLRNVGRGNRDLAIFEAGLVFRARDAGQPVELPGIAARPSDEVLAALDSALPAQPKHLAAVLCGAPWPRGWWGPGRAASWADAVEGARVVARTLHATLEVRAAEHAPWHPGRCAELLVGGTAVGYAGELHPRVIAAWGLPERTCAMELSLDLLPVPTPPSAPFVSNYPPVLLDVALVVDEALPSAAVEHALAAGAGELLESMQLFDVYAGESLGSGVKSLAFALRFRAPDRTLTVDEATAARDAALARAEADTGARLRT